MKAGGRFLFKLLSRDPKAGADVDGFRFVGQANEIKGRATRHLSALAEIEESRERIMRRIDALHQR
jgi:hypothetical protein